MSTGVLQSPEVRKTMAQAGSDQPGQDHTGADQTGLETTREEWIWSPASFAREQLRGLVQRTFFSGAVHPVRQVVISAADSRMDVADICRQVGEILSLETTANVAVAAGELSCLPVGDTSSAETSFPETAFPQTSARGSMTTRVRSNLWLSPGLRRKDADRKMMSSTAWYSRLCELRREFEYSILEGPAAGESSDAAIAAQVADGMILVLTAHGTRRATVQWIQETLKSTRTHLLGTILAERRFPIPEGIYRRL
jgi:hypothetical protein